MLTLFGTRPEVIKLAPVIHQLERLHDSFRTINVASGQHADLLWPLIEMFGIRLDWNLEVMTPNQTPHALCARILLQLKPIVEQERPDLILVQGDTTTALAGALVGFQGGAPVGHVEAGLRSGNISSPYPEEVNRTLITQLATYHFAATTRNRDLLLSEGIAPSRVFLTGNPVVDALQGVLRQSKKRLGVDILLQKTAGRKCIVLTTHRRESFGDILAENLRVLCRFVQKHDDVVLVFPVHPNPNVKAPAKEICDGNPRVILTEPLNYEDFIVLLSSSWLIVSDSGGIQEEVPSLGKPLLILRENTERTECIEAGIARLVGGRPEALRAMLEEAYEKGSWVESVGKVQNPFGYGDSGERVVQRVGKLLGVEAEFSVTEGSEMDGPKSHDPQLYRSEVSEREAAIAVRSGLCPPVFPSAPVASARTAKAGLTIVVPCFNEEPVLPYLRNTLRSVRRSLGKKYAVHLILVDDGSTDHTWQLLQQLFGTEPNCKLLQHPTNVGLTAAILTGIRSAQTEVVCSIDCDCSYDPHELERLVPLLTEGVDLVTGSPYHPLGKVIRVSSWRLALSKMASRLYRRVLRHKLHTYTSCFRVYRRSAVLNLDIKKDGFLGIAELIGKLDLQGSVIVECPTTLEVRILGRSKMKTAQVILGHLCLLGWLLTERGRQRFFTGHPLQRVPVKSADFDEQPRTTEWAQ